MLRLPVYFVVVLLSAACYCVFGETGCPDEEAIAPCKCIKKPIPSLTCQNITQSDVILQVFRASERYTYQEVYIIDSVFPFFPTEVLEKTTVKELYFKNSVFIRLFDNYRRFEGQYEDEYKHLYKISIDNVRIQRGFLSSNFSSFIDLTDLRLNYTEVRFLPSTFKGILPKSIKRLEFYGTRTKIIRSGALSGLPHLDKFVMESSNLKNLSRDIFPRPFNGRILYFDNNKIDSIPDDMFTDMPNLQILSMRNNIISTIPEVAFSGRKYNIPIFSFGGNPLVCDCQVRWIFQDKPMILEGECTSPDAFKGREFSTIKSSEFEC